MREFCILTVCLLAVEVAPSQPRPANTPQQHEEVITASRHEFRIRVAGTVDGFNTLDPVFSAAPKQAFELMRSVRLENTGDVDVLNPWLLVNGKRNWRTTDDIIEEALASYGNPGEMSAAEKARAVYEFLRNHRFHATTGDFEVRDPVKLLNIYGYALCGDNASVLMDLWRIAGLPVRRGFPSGHCVSEVFYDGGWHMFDADESQVFLERDNATIAGDEALARDHDLVKRGAGEMDAALYAFDGGRGGEYASYAGHTMRFSLRPGEALEWRWDHTGKHHYAAEPLYAMRSAHLREHWGDKAWARLSNGKWVCVPPLRNPKVRETWEQRNTRWLSAPKRAVLAPARAGEPASVTWKMSAPYVIVGGRLAARVWLRKGGAAVFSVSLDGRDWKEALRVSGPAQAPVEASLDALFPNEGAARYRYWIRVELIAGASLKDAGLESLAIENDLQMAPLSLPSLALGMNHVLYLDETKEPHSVRVVFRWEENSSLIPPRAPAAPVFPADGTSVEGTEIAFRWEPAAHLDAERIAAYHFQLGSEPSLRWALSSAFDRLLAGGGAGAPPVFHLGPAGLLNPGTRYYWRVRAKGDKGAWSPWSAVWSFVPQSPGVPLNLRLVETGTDEYQLTWEPNPNGRKPARYRVYASNEKGFTVSDMPYLVATGNQKERGLFPGREKVEFPANLLATVEQPRLRLRPSSAFYRVVAVDEKGNRSGPAEAAAAPRPFIYSRPVTEARVGTAYRYEAKTIQSIGDLSYRDFPPDQFYQAAFWEPDRPRFSLVEELSRCGNPVPRWLSIEAQSGVLSGTPGPGDAGDYQINVKVEIEGAGAFVQSFPLRVRTGP